MKKKKQPTTSTDRVRKFRNKAKRELNRKPEQFYVTPEEKNYLLEKLDEYRFDDGHVS